VTVVLLKAKFFRLALTLALPFAFWLCYAYGGGQGAVPGVKQAQEIAETAVNGLEASRRNAVENLIVVVSYSADFIRDKVKNGYAVELPTVAAKVEPTATVQPQTTATSTTEPEISVTIDCVPVKLKVTVESVNLRPNRNTVDKPIVILKRDEVVEASGVNGAWIKVNFFGAEGWMANTTLESFHCESK
jgi:hypothetical protein